MREGSRAAAELARGLPAGGSRSGLLCPRCGGGRTGEHSFGVYRTERGIGWRCHRAGCGFRGFLAEAGTPGNEDPILFEPRPYPYGLKLPGVESFVWDLLRVPRSRREDSLSAALGCLTRADNENEIVWEVRDFQWSARGHISRLYPEKSIRIWKTVDAPFYNYMALARHNVVWIVEDNVSAAAIVLAGGNAVALMGTHFPIAGQYELGAYLKGRGGGKIRVALDPDAAHVALRLARDLTFRLGHDTMYVPMVADSKDLSGDELAKLLEDFS